MHPIHGYNLMMDVGDRMELPSWHSMGIDEAFTRLESNSYGLSESEADARLKPPLSPPRAVISSGEAEKNESKKNQCRHHHPL